jgi:hypothetical protein
MMAAAPLRGFVSQTEIVCRLPCARPAAIKENGEAGHMPLDGQG